MRKTISILAMVLCGALAMAQTNQVVWLNGKVMYGHPVTTIDSITYDMSGILEGDTLSLILPRSTRYVVHDTIVKTNTVYVKDTVYINKCGSEGIGVFSVSADKQVSFAKGNLQYQASTKSWRFAENQYDYISNANTNISATYDGWIDLFGWGTSGYNNTANDPAAINYQPWAASTAALSTIAIDSTQNCDMQLITGECGWDYTYMDGSNNTYGYGPSYNMTDENLVGLSANYDWGVYNAISNGGNQAGMWRTLTSNEWRYLFYDRKDADYLWSQGTVNGVYGVIILPDNFSKSSSISWTYQANNWTTNTYTAEQWATLQAIGAVFLPAAGGRYSQDNVTNMQTRGLYWSSTALTEYYAYYLYFSNNILNPQSNSGDSPRYYGYSVRLVQDL